MTSAHEKNRKYKKSEAGFVAAEFLFSFILVISCGLIIFALTFSLMTVEVAQYITWSAARAYSSANKTKAESEAAGQKKFANLSAALPLLTGGSGEWSALTDPYIGPARSSLLTNLDPNNRMGDEARHPWSGATASIQLKLFESLKVPFLGPISNNPETFKFSIHAFMLRNPSQEECQKFFKDRFSKIKEIPDYKDVDSRDGYVPHEDNGC